MASFEIPAHLDANKMSAKLENGVLKIKLAKKVEETESTASIKPQDASSKDSEINKTNEQQGEKDTQEINQTVVQNPQKNEELVEKESKSEGSVSK